jgi:hypothetical protein
MLGVGWRLIVVGYTNVVGLSGYHIRYGAFKLVVCVGHSYFILGLDITASFIT